MNVSIIPLISEAGSSKIMPPVVHNALIIFIANRKIPCATGNENKQLNDD